MTDMFFTGGCEDGRSTRGAVGVKLDVKKFLCLLILRVEILAVVLEDERGPQLGELPVDRVHWSHAGLLAIPVVEGQV